MIAFRMNNVGHICSRFWTWNFLNKVYQISLRIRLNSRGSQKRSKFFFGNVKGFFRKKVVFFSKSQSVVLFCRMRIKWNYFLEMFFDLIYEVFWLIIQKIFKIGKVKKYDEETEFWKKRFLLKRHLYQKGKAQKVPVVAGRLVLFIF